MLVDLRGVPAAKLRPTLRIVTEPFSQGRAGRDILDPLIDRGVCFPDPARPQAVDQYPGPVIGGGGFVGAFELDVIGRYSLGHRTRSTKVTPGAHAIVLLDQAGWHGAKALKVPSNISLMPLPPRAPELNGQENIWQFMRQNWLSNRVFKSFDDIVDHCCYAWNTLIDQPWKIMSIARRDWATVGHPM